MMSLHRINNMPMQALFMSFVLCILLNFLAINDNLLTHISEILNSA